MTQYDPFADNTDKLASIPDIVGLVILETKATIIMQILAIDMHKLKKIKD